MEAKLLFHLSAPLSYQCVTKNTQAVLNTLFEVARFLYQRELVGQSFLFGLTVTPKLQYWNWSLMQDKDWRI